MKMIAVLPSALIVSALLGCTQQASTAPQAARTAAAPAQGGVPAASTETNTFGESMDKTASNAARARDENYGPDSSSAPK
jgi:hypothetical protein